MRKIMLMIFLCLLSLPITGICQDVKLPPEWTFDKKDDIKNWGAANQLAPLEIADVKDKKGNMRSIVRTVSLGTDPYIFPDGNWQGFIAGIEPFDGGKYNTIYIGVRVNQSSAWQIYYVTEDDGQYSERQRQNFQVNKTDDFQDLEFKMETGGWKEKTITGFRLDPGTAAGIEAEIDYLSLRSIPGGVVPKAVEYNGKLAVRWGAIKERD